jgi:hypothetical protein
MSAISRRFALGALFVGAPVAAFARRHDRAWPGGEMVDVSPLRRVGDNTDADYLAETLPGYLRQYMGPGHSVRVRIDSVNYGVAGSNGLARNNGAVDTIEGVGFVDGREVPLSCSLQTTVVFPDIGGYAARLRQDMLARSFAQWLPRQIGL